jgi:hypothetical protein
MSATRSRQRRPRIHAPARPLDRPLDMKRRPERVPTNERDRFDWRPETELVVGVAKRTALDAILDRAWPVGRASHRGGTK